MKNFIYSLCFGILYFSVANLSADEPIASRMPSDDLSSTFLAKYQKIGEKEVIALRIPKWKVNMAVRTREVTLTSPEVRTRTVKDKNGNEVEQTYIIGVPTKQTITENYRKHSPLPPVKGEIPLADIKAWNIKGKAITSEELKIALAKPTHLFGLAEEPEANQPPIDPFYATAFRSDLIFVYSPKLNALYEQSFEFLGVSTDSEITAPSPSTEEEPSRDR